VDEKTWEEMAIAWKELYDMQGEYVEWLEGKIEQLSGWQKKIIDLHENKDIGLDELMIDLEGRCDMDFRQFCKDNNIIY